MYIKGGRSRGRFVKSFYSQPVIAQFIFHQYYVVVVVVF